MSTRFKGLLQRKSVQPSTLSFGCAQVNDHCFEGSVWLSPYDCYSLMCKFDISSLEFLKNHLVLYCGHETKFPLVRFASTPLGITCPLQQSGMCSEPQVITPLARSCDIIDKKVTVFGRTHNADSDADGLRYINDWMVSFGVSVPEQVLHNWADIIRYFTKNNRFIRLSDTMGQVKKSLASDMMAYVAMMLYGNYDVNLEFDAQLRANFEVVVKYIERQERKYTLEG